MRRDQVNCMVGAQWEFWEHIVTIRSDCRNETAANSKRFRLESYLGRWTDGRSEYHNIITFRASLVQSAAKNFHCTALNKIKVDLLFRFYKWR